MENASKALEMAAGVLIGVMLFALVAYFLSNIGGVDQTQDESKYAEQLSKFNTQFEAYEKSAMYGVDVISCLNKAVSNNEKYGEQNAFYNGGTLYGSDWEKFSTTQNAIEPNGGESCYDFNNFVSDSTDGTIDIMVKLKSPLEEKLIVTYIDYNDKLNEKEYIGLLEDPYGVDHMSASALKTNLDKAKLTFSTLTMGDLFKNNDYSYSLYTKSMTLYDAVKLQVEDKNKLTSGNGTTYLEKSTGYYSLLFDSEGRLENLLNIGSNSMKSIYKNTNNDYTLYFYKTITWETALYNFKERKFKCDQIDYSSETGRIKRIWFSEIYLSK